MRINKALRLVLNCFPLKNVFLMESIPNLADNTKAVFDEMIRRKMNEKYKFVWIIRGNENIPLPKIKNVKYVRIDDKRIYWYRITSKYLVCCNEWIRCLRSGQLSFYLSHGTPIKSVREYYYMPDGIDYCLTASKKVMPICAQEFVVPEEKLISLGFPRNDVFAHARCDMNALFPDAEFDSVFVWYPTYRQHKASAANNSDADIDGQIMRAFPIIHDAANAVELNECAKLNRVLVVIKPHFAQDTQFIRDIRLSNLVLIDDKFFLEHNVSSYEFVGSCDALITDYSSIYYDYTLCDKPIALVWEDYESYIKWPGFAPGVEQFLSGGEKIYTLEDMKRFIKAVAEGEDLLREERNRICDLVNCSRDGKNASRVVEFILEKAGIQHP